MKKVQIVQMNFITFHNIVLMKAVILLHKINSWAPQIITNNDEDPIIAFRLNGIDTIREIITGEPQGQNEAQTQGKMRRLLIFPLFFIMLRR